MKRMVLILVALCVLAGCGSKNNTAENNNTEPKKTTAELLQEAKILYSEKKYAEVCNLVLTELSYDELNPEQTNADDAEKQSLIDLYYVSYSRDNFLNQNYNEAIKYIDHLAPVDGIVDSSEIESIQNDFPLLIESAKTSERIVEKTKRKQEGVSIGMTEQEVLDSSWGEPEKRNRTTTKYGVSEQWVYDDSNYLYFEDGILTAIQN